MVNGSEKYYAYELNHHNYCPYTRYNTVCTTNNLSSRIPYSEEDQIEASSHLEISYPAAYIHVHVGINTHTHTHTHTHTETCIQM